MKTKKEQREFVEMLYNKACEKLKILTMLPDVSFLPDRNQKAIIAFYKLSVIIQYVNEDWEPNWEDSSELKYYPWFDMRSAGLGCSATYSPASATNASIGSPVCFKRGGLVILWGEKNIA